MKKLLLTITTLTLGLSIIPIHGAERKRMAESDSPEGRAAKKQRHNLTEKLSAAIKAYNVEEVISLLNHGANPNIMHYADSSGIIHTINPVAYFILLDRHPVHMGYRVNNGMFTEDAQTAIIIALAKSGLNVDALSHDIPLLTLSAYKRQRAHITQTLINLGADVNQPITLHIGTWRNATIGMTPLMAAGAEGNIDDIKLLLKNGANPLAVDGNGHDISYYLDKQCSEGMMTHEKRQEILKIIEPYKKAYREASEQKAIHAKRQAANMDVRED